MRIHARSRATRLTIIALLAFVPAGCGRFGFGSASGDADARAPDADTAGDATGSDAARPFCAGRTATLCSDFEDGALGAWTAVEQTNAAFSVTPGGSASDYALVATSDAIDATYAAASVEHLFGVAAQRIVVSLDMRIDTAGTGDPVILQVIFVGAAEEHGIEYVYVAPPGLSYLEEYRRPLPNGTTQYDSWVIPGSSLAPQQWHRIELDADLRAAPRVIVRHDGIDALDTPILGTVTGTAKLRMGLPYLGGSATTWTLREDNVLADVE